MPPAAHCSAPAEKGGTPEEARGMGWAWGHSWGRDEDFEGSKTLREHATAVLHGPHEVSGNKTLCPALETGQDGQRASDSDPPCTATQQRFISLQEALACGRHRC